MPTISVTNEEYESFKFFRSEMIGKLDTCEDEQYLAEYEQHRYTLLPKFIYNNSTVRAITYLPDFVGDNFVIECKGFATDSWANREKLFKYYLSLNEPDTKFYLVKNKKQVDELINKLKS